MLVDDFILTPFYLFFAFNFIKSGGKMITNQNHKTDNISKSNKDHKSDKDDKSNGDNKNHKKGFVSMSHEKVQEIARKGGEASHGGTSKKSDDSSHSSTHKKTMG